MHALLDPKAVALDLSLTVQRVGELARANSLPSFKIGKYRRFLPAAVEQFKTDLASGRLKLPAAPRSRPTAPLAAAQRRRRTSTHRREK
jgi:hypothetical protein